MSKDPISRRDFLGTVAVILPASQLLARRGEAQDLPKITEDDPAGMALSYVHDASKVDPATNPRYEAGQDCANCVQIQGEEGAEWRPCAIFPGKLVASAGWCSVWAPLP